MADKRMLTDFEYVGKGGCICPHCHSEDVESDERSFEQGEAYLDMDCNDCERRWTEVYEMKGWVAR